MKKAEIKAKVSTGIIPYIASVENVEIAGIENAVEVALKEYTVANDEVKESQALMEKIEGKIVITQEYIEKIKKEIRKTEGSYKRSVKRETLIKLYNRMVELRGVLEDCEPKADFLQQMYKAATRNFEAAQKEKEARAKALVKAAKQEGFKYCVTVLDFNGEKKFEYVRTVAEAVSFIYMNAEGLSSWQIRRLGICNLAKGKELDVEIFSDLIEEFDEKYIEAEYSAVSEKVEKAPATIEEEFNRIEVKAIHNFTFGNYIESIEELKKFVSKASGELKKTALKELQEWLEIARAEGVEVEDFQFEESADNEKDSEKAEAMKATFEEISRKLQVSYRTGKNGNKRKIWGVYVKSESSIFSGWYKIEQAEARKILEGNGWTIKDFIEETKKANHEKAILKAKKDAESGRNYAGTAIKNPAKIEDAAKYYGLTVEEMQAIFTQTSKKVENEDHTASNNCAVTDEMIGLHMEPVETSNYIATNANFDNMQIGDKWFDKKIYRFDKTADVESYLYTNYEKVLKERELRYESAENALKNGLPIRKVEITNKMLGLTFSDDKKNKGYYYYCNFKAMQIGEKYFPARRIYVGASSRNAEYEIDERKAAAKVAILQNLPITPKKTAKVRKTFESGLETSLFSEVEETPKESIIKFETGKYYAGESSACNAYIVYKCVSRSKDKVTLQESFLVNEAGEKIKMRGDIGTFKISVYHGEHEEVRLEKRRYVWACSLYNAAADKTAEKVQYWSYELTKIIPPDYENVSFLGAEYVEKLRAKYEAMEKEITGYKEELGDSGKYRVESVVYSYGYDNELKETVSRCRVMVEYTDDEGRGWTATASQIWLNSYSVKTDVTTGEVVDEWGAVKVKMLDSLFEALPDAKETKTENVNGVYHLAATADLANITYLMQAWQLEREYRAEKGNYLVSQVAQWNIQEKAQTLKNIAAVGKEFLLMYFSYKKLAKEYHTSNVKARLMLNLLNEQLQKEGAQVRRFDTLYWKNDNAGKTKTAEKYAARYDEHYQKYDGLRNKISELYGTIEQNRTDEKYVKLVVKFMEEQAAEYVEKQPVNSNTSENDDGKKIASNTKNQIKPISNDFYVESEESAMELVKPFENYYNIKIQVERFEHVCYDMTGRLMARVGDFKSLYLSNRFGYREIRIYIAKIIGKSTITKKFTQEQIEGIAKYLGLKLKDEQPTDRGS